MADGSVGGDGMLALSNQNNNYEEVTNEIFSVESTGPTGDCVINRGEDLPLGRTFSVVEIPREIHHLFAESPIGYSELQPAIEERSSESLVKLWEMNYHEASIYLEEGENNEKFDLHPRNEEALPAYILVHNHWFYSLDLVAAFVLMGLALTEKPAVPGFALGEGIHASIELLCLSVMVIELVLKFRWMGFRPFFKHKRTLVKTCALIVMLIEAMVVLSRQTSHFRITRSLRPVFLIDNHYCKGIRRMIRQILQSLPPILDMLTLLFFFMLIFSVLGFYFFSSIEDDPYFATLERSFVSLFVLLTTANFPDVMMPSYAKSKWSALFFIAFLVIHLYLLMNLMLAVVYETFTNIEKDKFRKLLLHRRKACQFAFRLLVTRNNPSGINFKNFEGLMKYYKPKNNSFLHIGLTERTCRRSLQVLFEDLMDANQRLRAREQRKMPNGQLNLIQRLEKHHHRWPNGRRDNYLMFKTLNNEKNGLLGIDEFFHVYEASPLKWKPRRPDDLWFNGLSGWPRKVFEGIHRFVTWQWTDSCITDQHEGNTVDNAVSLFFVSLYTFEVILKIIGLGFMEYFHSSWNKFDFFVTMLAIAGIIAEEIQNTPFAFIIILRPLRLLRLFKLKKRYRDVLGSLFIILPRFFSVALVLVIVYYFFGIIGVEVFSQYNLENCCKNTTVEEYYRFENDTVNNGYYFLNNFGDFVTSGVTLFELMIVNNWFIIMDGYASVASEWSRIFFMLFYITTMVVINIVVAFVLEAFIFRIQYKRITGDMDKDSLVRVDITLTREELDFCYGNSNLSLSELMAYANDLTLPTVTYRGTRTRTKFSFSLKMYAEEVKVWLKETDEEEEKQRQELMNRIQQQNAEQERENAEQMRRTFTI